MELLNTIVAGLVVSVVTSVLTVRLALGRHSSERWWERRLDAYTRVHDALAYQLRQTKAEYDSLNDFYEGQGLEQPIPDEMANELRRNWLESERALQDAVVRGAFLLSEDAVTLLQRYQEEQRELDIAYSQQGPRVIDFQLRSAQDAVDEFGKLIKKDLRIAGSTGPQADSANQFF